MPQQGSGDFNPLPLAATEIASGLQEGELKGGPSTQLIKDPRSPERREGLCLAEAGIPEG
jgi:hypothetical protein